MNLEMGNTTLHNNLCILPSTTTGVSSPLPSSDGLSSFTFHKSKGHFILWLSVERTRDFSNLIGEEQKFVRLAFVLKANGQWPPKCLHGNTFWKFWRQEFV
jgi:hypothetical protein